MFNNLSTISFFFLLKSLPYDYCMLTHASVFSELQAEPTLLLLDEYNRKENEYRLWVQKDTDDWTP